MWVSYFIFARASLPNEILGSMYFEETLVYALLTAYDGPTVKREECRLKLSLCKVIIKPYFNNIIQK
jgi:hypothetical protein